MAEFLSSDPKVQDAHPHSVYDLIANICHDGQPGEWFAMTQVQVHYLCILTVLLSDKGTYRVHVRHKVRHCTTLCLYVFL